MCWIEVPSHVIGEEVRARLETDASAIELHDTDRGITIGCVSIFLAFAAGLALGYLFSF